MFVILNLNVKHCWNYNWNRKQIWILKPDFNRQAQASGGAEAQPKSDEDNRSQSESSGEESNLSSLGPWGDDPEIQEKVRYPVPQTPLI